MAVADRLPIPVSRELVRFVVVGLLNTAIGLAVIVSLYTVAGLGLAASNAAGYAVGLVVSFILNGKWTFTASQLGLRQVIGFAVVFAMSFGISLGLVHAMMSLGVAYPLAQLCGVGLYSGVMFVGMKYAVFAR